MTTGNPKEPKIHSAIERHYYLTPDQPSGIECIALKEGFGYWERHGDQINDLIQYLAQVNGRIATDIQSYLSDIYSGDPSDGEEDPYGDDAHYAEREAETYEHHESWSQLCNGVKYKARFFNQAIEDILNDLFCDLELLKTNDGKPILRKVGFDTDLTHIYRARFSQSDKEIEKILTNPVEELGAPPSIYAKHGRMNSVGISVFYGASDIDTCIAEVRPPVGSDVVIGRFQFVKELTLLDFNRLTQCYAEGSFFDPNFKTRLDRAKFLEFLAHELSSPIMPGAEVFEYLPTQVIAEYLSEKLKLNGMIFNSSQSDGQNIVLFRNCFKVKPYDLPKGAKVIVSQEFYAEDDYDDSITVHEEVSIFNNTEKDTEFFNAEHFLDEDYLDGVNISLVIDVKNDIYVRTIRKIQYSSKERSVFRYRSEKKTYSF